MLTTALKVNLSVNLSGRQVGNPGRGRRLLMSCLIWVQGPYSSTANSHFQILQGGKYAELWSRQATVDDLYDTAGESEGEGGGGGGKAGGGGGAGAAAA